MQDVRPNHCYFEGSGTFAECAAACEQTPTCIGIETELIQIPTWCVVYVEPLDKSSPNVEVVNACDTIGGAIWSLEEGAEEVVNAPIDSSSGVYLTHDGNCYSYTSDTRNH